MNGLTVITMTDVLRRWFAIQLHLDDTTIAANIGDRHWIAPFLRGLTMRLSDAGLRCCESKLLYPNHRLPPWPNEDAPRDRSNR
jgi:hypothetical protein